MEYNSKYIGVDSAPINGLRVCINYSGGAQKNVILMEAQMASIGYIENKNGKINYLTAIGIIRKVGSDPVPRTAFINGYPNKYPTPQNPYWVEIDCSSESYSDVRTIYIRDIRDITVGKAPIEPSIPEVSGYELPQLTEANRVFYTGKMFVVNPKPPRDKPPMFHNPYDAPSFDKEHHHKKPEDQPGIYFCTGVCWVQLTIKQDTLSSPLVAPMNLVGRSDHIPMREVFELSNKVIVGPINQKRDMMALGGLVNQEFFNEEEHGINSTIDLVGNTVTVRLNTTGLKELYTEYVNICKINRAYMPRYTGEVYIGILMEKDGDILIYSWYIDQDGLWVKFPEIKSIDITPPDPEEPTDPVDPPTEPNIPGWEDGNNTGEENPGEVSGGTTGIGTAIVSEEAPTEPTPGPEEPPTEEIPDPYIEAFLKASKKLMFRYDI